MRSKSFIEKIIRNPIIQTFVIFISGSWIILEITEYFIENFDLNESTRNVLIILLLSIFPIVIFFAWYLSRKQDDTERASSEESNEETLKTTIVRTDRRL